MGAATTVRVAGHLVWSTRGRSTPPTPDLYPTDPETGELLVAPAVYRLPAHTMVPGTTWVDARTGIEHRVLDHMEPLAWATYERVAKWFGLRDAAELRALIAAGAVDAGVLTGTTTRRYRVVSTPAVRQALNTHRNPVKPSAERRRVQTYRKPARAAR